MQRSLSNQVSESMVTYPDVGVSSPATARKKLVLPLPEQYASETLRVSAGATYLGSSAKAERELGFHARPLVEGLRETLTYEMKQLGIQSRQ